MKRLAVLPVCIGCLVAASSSQAIDLKQSKVTQVVNDVQIISAANQSQKAVVVNDIFSMPDILRTGAGSRAELIAPDDTVTRVGANTIFSFDPENRSIDLKQGSLLFHSQHGKGGGSIHTGSATASVLGTTIIVVSTPNGGFKVLVLEGSAEVKFLNGLKQKLDAGQMTFVLPGANQLAPIVIFRLDELTGNSLLVKGFTQPLDSIGQIQANVGKQGKDIAKGLLTDTGLNVGDNANSVQVEVLDANTVFSGQDHQPQQQQQQPPPPQGNPPPPPHNPPPPDLNAAEGADATINQPSLIDASIPTPPMHVILTQPFVVPDNAYFGPKTFSGFVARNIFFNTLNNAAPGVAVKAVALNNVLDVNLLPYNGVGEFDMVALGDMSFEGSVNFNGLNKNETLGLIAGDAFSFTPGITLDAECDTFALSSASGMDLNNVALVNNTKDINLNSGDYITFENGTSVTTAGRIVASAENDINVNDSTFGVGTAQFISLNGNISVQNSTIKSKGFTQFTAPASIGIDNTKITADSVVVNGTASAKVTINNADIEANTAISVVGAYDVNVTGDSPVVADARPKNAIVGTTLSASDPTAGSVSLTSLFGSVNVSGTSISAHMLTLNSGDGILLDGTGHSFTGQGDGSKATLAAPNLVTVNNADFSSFAQLNMAANTIVLANDILALISNFGCLSGQANFGNSVVQGDVNFYNCTWNGQAVTAGNVQLTGGPVLSSGIHVYPK